MFISNYRRPKEIKYSITLRDIYNDFKKEYKELSNKVSKTEFFAICKKFNTKVIDYLYFEAGDFNLGYRLGHLHVRRELTTQRLVNYPESKKQNTTIFYDNANTGYTHYKLFWLKDKAPNTKKFRFRPTKGNKVKLSQACRDRTVKCINRVN